MAKQETVNEPKDLIEPVPEELEKLDEDLSVEEIVAEAEKKGETIKQEREMTFLEKRAERERKESSERLASWIPKTKIGREVKEGKEKDIDNILENKKKILEPEIVDSLLKLESDLLSIGQAKGKFGGGKRRAWRQTQKKTKEGNVLTFSAMAVVGDKDGHVGVGFGKSKETLPSREKAVRKAKLNLIRINRGCAHFDCSCNEKHTVPYVVVGKCGSVRIKLIPAPQGTGLVVGDECKKILRLAGIKDVYSNTYGSVKTTFNLAKACLQALEKTKELIR
ncbi:MAG: 30S ribosomal protein S5 [Candidatus Pacearchaeota archaeon]|nr:30S ribosomal protein S5 [Candidatus Pacearchaeota archaeon]